MFKKIKSWGIYHIIIYHKPLKSNQYYFNMQTKAHIKILCISGNKYTFSAIRFMVFKILYINVNIYYFPVFYIKHNILNIVSHYYTQDEILVR